MDSLRTCVVMHVEHRLLVEMTLSLPAEQWVEEGVEALMAPNRPIGDVK